MRSPFRILLLASYCTQATAAELTQELLQRTIQQNAAAFEKIEIAGEGKPASIEIKLGETTATADDLKFDGFRFIAPEVGKRDFIWYFNVPNEWAHWYILPTEGEPARAFRDWLDADMVYEAVDDPREVNRKRVFQTLSGEYFEPGREYIVWFREVEATLKSKALIRAEISFSAKAEDGAWDVAALEKALELKPLPAKDQVEALDSRGGRILLDGRLFTRQYAENRIDDLFSTIRETRQMQGGFFITMQTAVPPCKTTPLFSEIRRTFGDPDFVRDDAERKKLGLEVEGDESVTTHFYDHFGFEVGPDDRVLRVVSQASDFSELIPEVPAEAEGTFGWIQMENLTVFHRGRKEVGRAYFFREQGKEPKFITVPPAGVYGRYNEELEFLGNGDWEERQFHRNGQIARKYRYENHKQSGEALGFWENGKPQFVATFKDGLLEGEVTTLSENGEKTKKMYRAGELVE